MLSHSKMSHFLFFMLPLRARTDWECFMQDRHVERSGRQRIFQSGINYEDVLRHWQARQWAIASSLPPAWIDRATWPRQFIYDNHRLVSQPKPDIPVKFLYKPKYLDFLIQIFVLLIQDKF